MARKRRSRKRQKPIRQAVRPRPAQAQKALQDGQFKTAINAYKASLKEEQRPEWVAALAEAYEGRSWELAGQGMVKEAVAMWRNRAQACNLSLDGAHYLLWLLQAGYFDEALRLYRQHEPVLGTEIQSLRAHLAALALAGKDQILSTLPAEDPVVRDHPAALQALQAYCDGDDTAVKTAISQITFRSPYRELRVLLSALIEKNNHPQKTQDIISRIDKHSPFAALATAVGTAVLDGEQMIEALAPMDPFHRRFVVSLKGWPQSHLAFLEDLISLHQSPGDKQLLRFLIRHEKLIGGDYSRLAAVRYVMHHPESTRAYDRGFGTPAPFDRARIIALMRDPEAHSPYDDYEYWDDALQQFRLTFDLEQDQNRLRAALLMRRIADVLEKGRIEPQALKENLEESLVYDPDDPPTYLRLIRLYREERRFKDARRVQDQALQRYPRDTDVLLAIVETSIASNAFKKAADFARRILEIDPINPKVRAILFEAHLAHARKQVKQDKSMLALKELEQAAQWDDTQSARDRIALVQGIMELRHERAAGIKQLRQTMAQQGNSLQARFRLLMEADRLQRRCEEIMKWLELPTISAEPKQVVDLAHTLRALPQEDEERVSRILLHLHKPLEKAAGNTYQQADMDLLCEVFKRYEQPQLRRLYAKAALRRWPKAPLFVYHRIDAQSDIHDGDLQDLETALKQAHEAGDPRTAHRIDELLQTAYGFGGAPFAMPGPDEEIEDRLVMELIRELGPEGFLEVLKSMNLPEFEADRKIFDEEQILEILEHIAKGGDPTEGYRDPFPNPFKGRRKRPPRKPPKRASDADSAGEIDTDARNDESKQFNLF